MSDTRDNDEPARLSETGDEIERELWNSAKLDRLELIERGRLRAELIERMRAVPSPHRRRSQIAVAAVALAAVALAAVTALMLSRLRVQPTLIVTPEPAETEPNASARSAASVAPTAPVLAPCPASIAADGSAPLIDDFEDRNARLLIQDGRSGTWTSTGDAASEQSPRAGENAFPVAIPRRGKSRYGLHFTGAQLKTGAGIDGSFAPGKCYDASRYAGIEFWAKGGGRIHLMVSMSDVIERKWGGLCDEKCYDPHRAPVDLHEQWERHVVLWEELAQVGYGTQLAFDARRLWSVQFFVDSADTPFDVWIDDVAFVPR